MAKEGDAIAAMVAFVIIVAVIASFLQTAWAALTCW